MLNLSPPRLISALLLIVAGAIFASQLRGSLEQVVVMVTASLTALFIALDAGSPRIRKKMVRDSVAGPARQSIVEHSDFSTLVEGIADPVIIVQNASVTHANGHALRILGNHIIGEDVRTAIRHPAASERLANPETQHKGEPTELVGVGRPDQHWEMRVKMLDAEHKLVHLADRSGRHAAEQMRIDFVANASHELRTPLASIKGYIETLEDPDAGGDPKTRGRFLGIMLDEAKRMQQLIIDLMSLSRIEAEKYKAPETPVNIAALIEEVRQVFVASGDPRGDDIKLSIPEELPTVAGEKSQLSQLLHNLIGNSAKYGRTDTAINVTAETMPSGSMVKISVEDQGEGIAAEHLPRLTERFYRVDSGRSRAVGGTGLGLSIVKHIVEHHRGRLEIDSTPGIGTKTSILLPIVAAT